MVIRQARCSSTCPRVLTPPHPPHRSLAQLARVLARVEDWQYDMFALEDASRGRPLSVLAYALLTRMGVVHLLHLDETRLIRWGSLAQLVLNWCSTAALHAPGSAAALCMGHRTWG